MIVSVSFLDYGEKGAERHCIFVGLQRIFPVFHNILKGFYHYKKDLFVSGYLNSKYGYMIFELMNHFSYGIIVYGTTIINNNYFFQSQYRVNRFVSGFLNYRIID